MMKYFPAAILYGTSVALLKADGLSAMDVSFRHTPREGQSVSSRWVAKELKQAFLKNGADAVRRYLTRRNDLLRDTVLTVQSIHEAAKGDNGCTCTMFNAVLGASYDLKDANLSLRYLSEFDNSALAPDIVSLSLVFATLSYHALFEDKACRILERAVALGDIFHDTISASDLRTNLPASLEGFPDLIYENEDFIVVDKPSGLVCYHEPGAGRVVSLREKALQFCDTSIEQLLLTKGIPLSTLNGSTRARGIVHRLDRGTSGCLLLAKTNAAHAKLIADLYTRRIQKEYMALVVGNVEHNDGTINLPIGGRPAQSTFQVVRRFGSVATLLRVKICQGRKHQVRIHCSKGLNCPVVLDPKYGGQRIMFRRTPCSSTILQDLFAQKSFCLHALSLSLPVEQYGSPRRKVSVDYPDWWNDVIQFAQAVENS